MLTSREDRTYKLDFDTVAEYGRYVKSLWEAHGGAISSCAERPGEAARPMGLADPSLGGPWAQERLREIGVSYLRSNFQK